MTKTYSLSTTRTAMLAFLFVMVASLAFAMPALAEGPGGNGTGSNDADGCKGPNGSNLSTKFGTCQYNKETDNSSAMSKDRLELLKQKISELEVKKNDLMTLLEKVKTSKDSHSPNSSGLGDWKNRLCKSGGSISNVAIPQDVRNRLCDKDKHGTSTPSVPKPPVTTSSSSGRATSTFKILEPNGGEGYIWDPEQRFGTLQKVRYTTPKGMTSVDISLQKVDGSDFYFMKGKDVTYPGIFKLGTVKLSGKGGTQKGFNWRATAVPGEGYKIVITGKVDGVTYTDSSDAIFSMTHKTDVKDRGQAGGPAQR